MISEYLRSIVRCPACLGSDDVATREGAQATRLSWNGFASTAVARIRR